MQTRICVLGNAGTGKSTLADKLGQKLNLPVYHLDREMLHGKFERHSDEHQLTTHTKLISGENWIIDGNYRKLFPDRLERATLVIFINISRLTALKRAIVRSFTKSNLRQSIPANAPHTLTWQLIRGVTEYSRRKRLGDLQESLKQKPHLELLVLNKGSLDNWVEQVTKVLR